MEYKLTQMTGQRAFEGALLLGTEVLPTIPKPQEKEPFVMLTPEEFAETPVLDTSDPDAEFLDRMMNVLALASDAKRLKARNAELEAKAQLPALPVNIEHAIASAYAIIRCVEKLHGSPIGMLMDGEYKNRSKQLTVEAKEIADLLQAHFKNT